MKLLQISFDFKIKFSLSIEEDSFSVIIIWRRVLNLGAEYEF